MTTPSPAGPLRPKAPKRAATSAGAETAASQARSFEKLAIDSMVETFATPGPAGELSRVLDNQESAIRPRRLQVDAKTRKMKAAFQRDFRILGDYISSATEALNQKWGPAPLHPPGLPASRRARLHLYVPDPQGTGRPSAYQLWWAHVDGGYVGAGIGASTDPGRGTFWASHYGYGTIQQNSYAGIGVTLIPSQAWSRLSIRPFVNWRGYDILSHRLYDPQLTSTGWGTAEVQIGIHVQSWDHSGGAFNNDAGRWVTVWKRSEVNPSGTREYNGTEDARTLQLEALASNQRRYAIWISCRAFIGTQSKFGLDIRASASVSCQLPFLFVEEIPV